jgi:hypothetical protein
LIPSCWEAGKCWLLLIYHLGSPCLLGNVETIKI